MIRRFWPTLLIAAIACDSTVESRQQQDLWNALDIKNYSYTFSVSCFCAFTGPNPARVTVRNGVVTGVTSTDASVTPFTGPFGPYPTIDSLFAIVARAKAQNPATLDVTYDATYHFPSMVFVDPVSNTADDEVTYHADSFTPSSSQ